MTLTISTPALLFPAISLLLLAYTNRFLTIANLIRQLHSRYMENPQPQTLGQIQNLRHRVRLIKDMQLYGIISLLLSVVCMFAIFAGYNIVANVTMGVSLLLLIVSLAFSVREIQISADALKILLSDMEK
ncbi:MAG: Protein of unknown function (DUF2721) [Bacteroidetes bacterium HLUCCA01]|nr:MAG: Protein of unknown function (DUF2721) [Bacteroidetes bacterium HLUCCA01]